MKLSASCLPAIALLAFLFDPGSLKAVIVKSTATVTLGNLTATYDGTAKPATATTGPAGLKVIFTYNGSARVPSGAGSYTVVGTVNDVNYEGSASGTLVIDKGTAPVTLGGLAAVYNGRPHGATATTVPGKLAVTFTYNGSATTPIAVGNYNVIATVNHPNYAGTATGTLVIAAVAPLVATTSATAITAAGATLNGTTNPKTSDTSVSFQYGTTTAYGSTTPAQDAGSGASTVTFSAGISVPIQTVSVVYHYRARATNVAGTTFGIDKIFTSLARSTIGTIPASYLGASGADVSLSVNPNGISTSVYFQYGLTTAYGSTTAAQSVGSGKMPVTVFAFFSDLTASKTYHYRMVTTSAAGTFFGPDETFTTLPFDTTLVVEKGEAAADINGATVSGATFATLGNPIVTVNDDVAFSAQMTIGVGGVTAGNSIGIWADDSTHTRRRITQLTAVAPGTTNATFVALGDPLYNNNNAVAFFGALRVAAGRATAANATGIWSTSSGSLALVARQGRQAPGCPVGATFGSFNSLGLSDSGGAIILATLNTNAAAGVSRLNNIGIWEGNTTDDLHLVLRLGDTLGGKTITAWSFLPAETFVNGQTRSFDSISGDIACVALFGDGTVGVIKVIGGTPQIAALGGSTIDTVTGARFISFGNPALNTNGHTAFTATITPGVGGVTTSNNLGIWADDSAGALQPIARIHNGAAPDTTASFLTFSDPVYNNNEAVAFRATLKVAVGEATSATATGIWCNSTGSLALVVRQGGQASGCRTGATFSGFTELALPDQGGATNNGGVILLATLNANSAAGVGATNNLGIWAVDTTGTLQLIVRTGDILNGKTVTGLTFLPNGILVNGQSRSFAQGNGDLVYLATFSDKSTAIFNVVFP